MNSLTAEESLKKLQIDKNVLNTDLALLKEASNLDGTNLQRSNLLEVLKAIARIENVRRTIRKSISQIEGSNHNPTELWKVTGGFKSEYDASLAGIRSNIEIAFSKGILTMPDRITNYPYAGIPEIPDDLDIHIYIDNLQKFLNEGQNKKDLKAIYEIMFNLMLKINSDTIITKNTLDAIRRDLSTMDESTIKLLKEVTVKKSTKLLDLVFEMARAQLTN